MFGCVGRCVLVVWMHGCLSRWVVVGWMYGLVSVGGLWLVDGCVGRWLEV